MLARMRIAVTGANGFVGQALCPFLENHLDAQIVKLTRKPTLTNQETSLSSPDGVLIEALKDFDCLIHLAARAHTRNSTSADFERDNQALTTRILNVCVAAKISRIIYLSSIKVNGNSTNGIPYTADDVAQPEDIYGQSKLDCEALLKQQLTNTETQWVIIRPPLVYGDKNKGNLHTLETLISKRIPLPFGKLNNRRDLISIENLCSLIALCITHPKASNEVFLASDDMARSTREIIQLLAKRKKIPVSFFNFPNWIFTLLKPCAPQIIERLTGDLQVDITKTKSLLGWTPDNK
jgi:UDP-glucose 4-epimerase